MSVVVQVAYLYLVPRNFFALVTTAEPAPAELAVRCSADELGVHSSGGEDS